MKPTEAAALLTIAAAFDNRKPDADQAKMWALALDGIRFEDARDVIIAHYRRTRDWLMPVDVSDGVRRLRHARLDAYGPIPAPVGIDPDDTDAYRRAFKATQRAIADGMLTAPPAIEFVLDPVRDVVAELGHIGSEVPND